MKVRALISGHVQGVWFRAWTEKEALSHGLDGWVRNRADGRVEAVFSGSREAVEAMLAACRHGPPLARVEGVELEDWAEAVEPGFRQRATV